MHKCVPGDVTCPRTAHAAGQMGTGGRLGLRRPPVCSRGSIRIVRPMRSDMHVREAPLRVVPLQRSRTQAETDFWLPSDADPTAIFRGFARSAIGMTTLSIPLS
jgi:hypothetical protein